MKLCKRTPIEETVAEMRRRCVSLDEDRLRRLRFDFDDKVVEVTQRRWYRWWSLLPWETYAEWHLRELLALRDAVTQALIDRSGLSLDLALGGR